MHPGEDAEEAFDLVGARGQCGEQFPLGDGGQRRVREVETVSTRVRTALVGLIVSESDIYDRSLWDHRPR
jgi:hypothetical protein